MPTTTTTYSFNKPVVGADEDDWGGYLNGNWDSVDDLLDGTTPITGIDINSGTIDNVVIGGTTAAAITGTTGQFNTSLNVDGNVTADGLGIGTSSPSTLFHIDAASDGRVARFGSGTSDTGGMYVTHNSGSTRSFELSADNILILDADRANGRGSSRLQFNVDGSERMRIDSSGNVGIGITSPTHRLDVLNDGGEQLRLLAWDQSASARANIDFWYLDGGGTPYNNAQISTLAAANAGNGNLVFSTRPTSGSLTERMRIDSSGNVGIGTSSPATKLDVNGDGLAIRIDGTANTSRGIMLRNTGTAEGQIQTDGNMHFIQEDAGKYMRFSTANTEAMRLDSSGNLLVGKSVTTFNTAGTRLTGANGGHITRDGNKSLDLNRLTSDGDILGFYKDGTTVGSIGTHSTQTYIGTGDTGIYFNAGNDSVDPYNPSVPFNRSDAISLGAASRRFKDLYLSGGVYLGGTGSANKLEDYEEGVFNVELWAGGTQLALSEYGGSYVKVGNLVSINFEADCSNTNGASGPLEVRGMPFTIADVLSPTGIEANGSVSYWQLWSTTINSPSLYAEGGTTLLYVLGSTSSTAASSVNLTAAHIGTGEFRGSITYRTT